MRIFILTLITVFMSLPAHSSDFAEFQQILDKYLVVTDLPGGGLQTAFDYDKFYKDPNQQKLISAQKEKLKNFDLKSLKNKNIATAFWINAYNFSMVQVIIEKGYKKGKRDVNSVKDFGSFFNPYAIFKKEFINIGGKQFSLDKIEKGTLLSEAYKKKSWKDARIHFAVNCASVGCPPLVSKIYTESTLDSMLDDNIRKAFKTPRHLSIKGKELHFTHLFKWYKKDFEEHSGSVKAFIKKYSDNAKSIDATKDVEHIDYDWKLNRPGNFK